MQSKVCLIYSIVLVSLVSGLLFWGSCTNKEQKNKRQQMARGKMLYKKHCQKCHKADGEGFKQLYPPLNKAEYLEENKKQVPCIIRYGMEEKIKVRGKRYNLAMPGNNQLSDHDITQLMSYIYNAWDNNHPKFEVENIKDYLKACDSSRN